MEKCMIEVIGTGARYSIPRENLKLLAMTKAIDLGIKSPLNKSEEEVIEFLNKIGINVEFIK